MSDEVGTIIGVIIAVIFVAILIIYILIRCCICCSRLLFGSRRRGADYGLHPPSGSTYVVINQNQQPVPIIQQIPRV